MTKQSVLPRTLLHLANIVPNQIMIFVATKKFNDESQQNVSKTWLYTPQSHNLDFDREPLFRSGCDSGCYTSTNTQVHVELGIREAAGSP